ncbi:MAG TPA: ThuA domain-containing protein, partial [Gammaproteobacteria bacterium]|nr:ThuA domain-containing protein [Gammaproteobacteria bacterium]
MKRRLIRGAAFCACLGALAARAAEPIPVLILDGESGGPYHDWPRVTAVLERVLGEVGMFQVSVATAPPEGGDFTKFAPNFAAFKAVVLNYDAPDERWPAALKSSLERYVENGGGMVSVHAAD